MVCYNVLKKRGDLLLKSYKKIKIFIGDELFNEYHLNKTIDNKYEYFEDEVKNTIELTEGKIIIIRENDEFFLKINSNNEEGLYILKELNYELYIKVNYFDYFYENNDLIIGYQLETNDKAIKLILEGE